MSLTKLVLGKVETVSIDASNIDMTKAIRLLRAIFGPRRPDISPLAFSIAVMEVLIYKEGCTIEDIKVMKDVYPVIAKQFGKSLNTAATNIERLTRQCWEKMVAENTVALYLGKLITERPATTQLLCYLAVFSHTGCAYFSENDPEDEASKRNEAVRIVENLLISGMSENELLEKLKQL